jgi:hypothetical protein
MAILDEVYSADQMPEGRGEFDPLPAGWYSATIADASLKETKSGTGKYIAVRYDITGPTHEGRVVFGNINIKNDNVKAEEIGRQQLGEIMRSIGLASVRDTDQLLGGNLQIKLAIKTDDWGTKNEVKGFKSVSGSAAPKPQPQSQPSSATGAKPPWAK